MGTDRKGESGGLWMMLGMGNGGGGMEKHVDRQQQRGRSGGEFILGRRVVVDGGRRGYMTFVSMVMVSLSPTRREMVL